jgi:hypothetical protein
LKVPQLSAPHITTLIEGESPVLLVGTRGGGILYFGSGQK